MKKTADIIDPTKFGCEFCKREFIREKTLVSHLCEQKQRWLSKDHVGNRLGFQSWLQFYKKNSMSKHKNKTYEEFIKSPYYIAFVKFGNYCAGANVVNVSRYVDYLLKENIKIDNWNTDKVYTTFLCDYLKKEDPFDAIHRSVETCIDMSENEKIQASDMLRYGNVNRICYAVTTGKISPWMLYCSESGVHFLEKLNPDHVKMITDYINPEQWALKFHREPDIQNKIRETLREAGY